MVSLRIKYALNNWIIERLFMTMGRIANYTDILFIQSPQNVTEEMIIGRLKYSEYNYANL